MSASQNTKNLPTASYVKNIDDDNWTYNWTWYDAKSRIIGSHTINHLGGYTKTETRLDFAGTTVQSKVYHKRLQSDPERTINQFFDYDNQNRLLVHRHQVDNNPIEILSQNEYNELSQLKRKKVGGTAPASPLQSIDYAYNIRGSLIKINDPANLNGKLFGYGIKYNNPEYSNVGSGKYNGSIAEIDWQNASENVQKRYTYTYDGLNRLKDAVYSEPASTTPFNNYYNEYLTYDVNGNIKTLKRNAFPVSGTTATQVDDLVYNYTGNRLTKVTENALNDTGYEGGNNTITYDLNGNMIDMPDKGIQSITYNFLNLSNGYSMQQTNGLGQLLNSTMSYLYRADGTKLRKTYSSAPPRGSTTTRITDYLDGFQYSYTEGGGICLECRTETAYEQQAYKNASFVFPGTPTPEWKLDFAATAEGYYSFTENRYIYQYKDHLGNTRVSFAKSSTGAPEIIDTNNYYPFGLNHISGSFSTSGFGSFYSYKYNGKELQENGMYDYGARMYMPDLGRWGTTDPLAEGFRRFSPYHYGADNPVMFIDPDGMRNVPYDGGMISNIPEGSWWFAGMNGSFTPDYVVNSGLGKRTGGGSASSDFGEPSSGGLSFTSLEAITFAQSYFGGGGNIGALFSMVEQLKKAGWSDPANTKAKYNDKDILLKEVPALAELFKITNSRLMEDIALNNSAETVKDVVYININKINNVLSYAFTLGHEMNHVFDNLFFKDKFSEITGLRNQSSLPFLNSFYFYKEATGLGWEMQMGNGNLKGGDGFGAASFYYGPNGANKYNQATIDRVKTYMYQLIKAREIEYNNRK
jgi:RHS repeat-associated protein